MLLGWNMAKTISRVAAYKDFVLFNPTQRNYVSAYFNSGFVPTKNTSVEVVMGFDRESDTIARGLQTGCRVGWVRGCYFINVVPANYNTNFRGSPWFPFNDSTALNFHESLVVDDSIDKHTYVFNGRGDLFADGVKLGSYDTDFVGTTYPFFIGDVNEAGTPKGGSDSQGRAKIYRFAISESGELVRDFVPIQNESGDIVMRDLCGNVADLSKLGSGDILFGTDP